MWLHRRKALIALSALFAGAACGFSPVYGPQGSASVLQDNLRVEAPNRRDGFVLSQRLEERFGRNDAGRYVLNVTSEIRRQGLATSVEGTTNRFRLTGLASYSLRDTQTDEVVRRGRVENFTGFSATGSTVATLAAERDATARLMVILADEIVDRLILASEGLAP
ncbi:LPS assembly lipoprotein LptE [Marivita hallyeonensis]|uniref:LPS-assembly lipoprotein n=1 Tax=Marivita hallyeonensis TaxID=996342 RepID=A0A1M5M5Z7_9RHOB|nr:LPS assembly lipoprotein LptE [Marivita hallyeonensis]SHG72163.1 LPS-assembly lipoprotein [Marivita hallyeonensis]